MQLESFLIPIAILLAALILRPTKTQLNMRFMGC